MKEQAQQLVQIPLFSLPAFALPTGAVMILKKKMQHSFINTQSIMITFVSYLVLTFPVKQVQEEEEQKQQQPKPSLDL